MRSKKLLILYAFLLIVAVVTMVQLWRLNQRPQEIGPRDYPEIKEEGILRMITEYNQSGYFVSGDTVQGFQYELSQAIAKLSGLEVQTHLEMSLAKSFEELSDNKCDVIARNIPITSEMRENYLFTEPIVLNKQVLVQRTAEANNGPIGFSPKDFIHTERFPGLIASAKSGTRDRRYDLRGGR